MTSIKNPILKWMVSITVFTLLINVIPFYGNSYRVKTIINDSNKIDKSGLYELYQDCPNFNNIDLNCFIENSGQLLNKEIRFYSADKNSWITSDGFWFRWQIDKNEINSPFPNIHNISYDYVVKQEMVNASNIFIEGQQKGNMENLTFIQNGKQPIIAEIYNEVILINVWPNIDIKYYCTNNEFKYDIILKPGNSIEDIELKWAGSNKIQTENNDKTMKIITDFGMILDTDLYIYQDNNGKRNEIGGKFRVLGNTKYGFSITGHFDPTKNIVIDPTISSSTFLGTADTEGSVGMDVDQEGNVYITGRTNSLNFPTTVGVYESTNQGWTDIFVSKFSSDLSQLLFSTYIGGSDGDEPKAISVDSQGYSYITGRTYSTDFPTTIGANDTTYNGGNSDSFIVKLNPTGTNLDYSTYIGGSEEDYGEDIAIDSTGNTYVTGRTDSLDFPYSSGAFNNTTASTWTIFMMKLSSDGSSLEYCTSVGTGIVTSIVLDSTGLPIIAGLTSNSNFPTSVGALDQTHNGASDAFIFKLNNDGSSYEYSTFIGGSDNDRIIGMSIDTSDSLFVTGYTQSADFPTTTGAYDTTYQGAYCCFVTKLAPHIDSFIYSTFIKYASGVAIDVDDDGEVYVTGIASPGFPTTYYTYDSTPNGGEDSMLLKLNYNGTDLLYSTFIGGTNDDEGLEIEYIKDNQIIIAGTTGSPGFPSTQSAYDTQFNGVYDAYVQCHDLRNEWNITSLEFKGDNVELNKLYAMSSIGTIELKTLSTAPIYDLENLLISIDPEGKNIQLGWDRQTNIFSEVNDPNDYIELLESSNSLNDLKDEWTITFDIMVNWTFPDEGPQDIQVYGTSATLSPCWLNASEVFIVENDITFKDELIVKDSRNDIVPQGSIIKGDEKLKLMGPIPVYEGTTEVYPPTEEFNITLWSDDILVVETSPDLGSPFNSEINVPIETDEEGIVYTLNFSGIPSESDASNVVFTVKIDADNVSFSQCTLDEMKWNIKSSIHFGITITDTGGALIDGDSILCGYSPDNGTTWDWYDKLATDSQTISPTMTIEMEDGVDNLVMWTASDTVGNGPSESPRYRVLVDTIPVRFSDRFPPDTNVSESRTVHVGVTISDTTSGVDVSTVQYSLSEDGGERWMPWVDVTGLESGNKISVSLNLEFPEGSDNMIKWRASDIAGNGPVESEPTSVVVELDEPIDGLWTTLVSPMDGATITTQFTTLEWEVETSLTGIKYDLYLGTTETLDELYEPFFTGTSLDVPFLSDQTTYYWTVIPRYGTEYGVCNSSVWSFTCDKQISPPEVELKAPEDDSVVNSTTVVLEWESKGGGSGWFYDLYFGEDNLPATLIEGGLTATFFELTDLIDGRTYYWTVVPISDLKVYGVYGDPIYSFTVDLSAEPDHHALTITPISSLTLKQGASRQLSVTVTNTGTAADRFGFSLEHDLGSQISITSAQEAILDPGGTATVTISIQIAGDTVPGDYAVTLVAKSLKAESAGLNVSASSPFTITVEAKGTTGTDTGGKSGATIAIAIAAAVATAVVVAFALLILLRRKRSAEPTMEGEKVEQQKVTWSPMSGKAVYDVDAARVDSDGSAHRLTKPVVPGSAPAGAIVGATGVPLLPKAQGVEGGQAAEEGGGDGSAPGGPVAVQGEGGGGS